MLYVCNWFHMKALTELQPSGSCLFTKQLAGAETIKSPKND
jgi:hypothetical protein